MLEKLNVVYAVWMRTVLVRRKIIQIKHIINTITKIVAFRLVPVRVDTGESSLTLYGLDFSARQSYH